MLSQPNGMWSLIKLTRIYMTMPEVDIKSCPLQISLQSLQRMKLISNLRVGFRYLDLMSKPGSCQFADFLIKEGIATSTGSNPTALCSGDLVLVASAHTDKLDFSSPSITTLHIALRAKRLLAASQWAALKRTMQDVLSGNDSTRTSKLTDSTDSSHSSRGSAPPVIPWHKKVTYAAQPLIKAAASLCQDLPSRHLSLAERSRIAAVVLALQKVQAQAEGACFKCMPPRLAPQCGELLSLLQELPPLPAVMRRASEDSLRDMCIADAALVCSCSTASLLVLRPEQTM